MMPAGHDADALRKTILEAYDMSLGTGWEARGEDIPNRTPRRFQRSDARRHPRRR